MRKDNPFLATTVLLSAILILGSQGRAGAAPLALGQPEELTAPLALGEPEVLTPKSGSCVPSLTVACVQNYRFKLSVFFNGTESAYVAASSTESAVFYFPGSSGDWQVVAKVLDGCGSTNHWWVYAAGATSTPYSVSVTDTVANVGWGFSELCPLENENTIPCP